MTRLISVEEQIIQRTIHRALNDGYALSVYDGEEITVDRSVDQDEIFAAMKTTDEDYLFAYDRFKDRIKRSGWIRFVYGNHGTEVICDYTTSMEPTMEPIFEWINEYVDRSGDHG